jgi:hypothetical protein
MAVKRKAYWILVVNPKGKRPLGRPEFRWEHIKMDVREIRWSSMKWIDLARDRDQRRALVNNGSEFSGSIKCWELRECLSGWRLLKKG